MNPQTSHRRDVFDVFQIALGVAMSVFLVAIYVRPMRAPSGERVREIRTQQTVYVVEVKYLSSEAKPPL